MLNTPVIMLVFNRPSLTQQVFDVVREIQPKQLLVVADGPRPDRSDDVTLTEQTRAIFETIDWDCDLLTNFRPENMGCRRSVSEGLNWAFDQVDHAIILEDDCVPDPTFFKFCDELLEYYKDDERIMHIGGTCFDRVSQQAKYSYRFSNHMPCWGWATWARAWRNYDADLNTLPETLQGEGLKSVFTNKIDRKTYERTLLRVYRDELNTWAYIWAYTIWVQHGLCIIPRQNMISNIGMGPDATHTTSTKSPSANLTRYACHFPLSHPSTMLPDYVADEKLQIERFRPKWRSRIKQSIKHNLNALFDKRIQKTTKGSKI